MAYKFQSGEDKSSHTSTVTATHIGDPKEKRRKGGVVVLSGVKPERVSPWKAAPFQDQTQDEWSRGEMPLFSGGYTTPASGGKVDSLHVSQGHEHLVGTLLGVASNRAYEISGKFPEPSSNLSPHSSRLVKSMQDRGVVGGSAKTDAVNSFNREGGDDVVHGYLSPYHTASSSDVSPARVAAGSKAIRQTIKQGRPVHVAEDGAMTARQDPEPSEEPTPNASAQFKDRRLPWWNKGEE